MAFREFVLENFAGDLEYHPKLGAVYLGLGVAALCVLILAPPDDRFTVIPLVFGVGSLPLFVKGIFFLRKTSEGLGLSHLELTQLSHRKALPPMPALTGQIIQDFGAGAFLLGPLLHVVSNSINDTWKSLPSFSVFLSGVGLFFIGWFIRRLGVTECPIALALHGKAKLTCNRASD